MGSQFTTNGDGSPLAVRLARDRLQEEAIERLFGEEREDSKLVSRGAAASIVLTLSPECCDQIAAAHRSSLCTDEHIQAIREDLWQSCHLVLRCDPLRDEPLLHVHSAHWHLVVKAATPAWQVVDIRPQAQVWPDSLTGLPWRLFRVGEPGIQPSPLPAWLLMRAQPGDPELRLAIRRLVVPDRPVNEHNVAARLLWMRERLPLAVRDLHDTFRLLAWERERRERASWTVTVAPFGDKPPGDQFRTYVIERGASESWSQRLVRFALGAEPGALRVDVWPDEESPCRWLLQGPESLAHEITLFELPDAGYRRQARVVARLTDPVAIGLEDTAIAATQIGMPADPKATPEVPLLVGEERWEQRQESALRLALAGNPACAIRGPPGTGKSTVIVGIIRRAVRAGQRVLLVAPTHVALDEVLGRIHALRTRQMDDAVVAARVTPLDEKSARVRPELQGYVARHLGQVLARSARQRIRRQIAAAPSVELLERRVQDLSAICTDLRELQTCRDALKLLQDGVVSAWTAFERAQNATAVCRTEFDFAQTELNRAQQQAQQLAIATTEYAAVERSFLGARDGLAEAARVHRQDSEALEILRAAIEAAKQRAAQAASVLENARSLELKRRPNGRLAELMERILALHARAVKAVESARTGSADARRALARLRRSLPDAEARLAERDLVLGRAQQAMDVAQRELRDRLSPSEDAIRSALGEACSDWLTGMPESLGRAVAMTSGRRAEAQQTLEKAGLALQNAEQLERTHAERCADARRRMDTEAARQKALETALQERGIDTHADLPHQTNKVDGERAACDREREAALRRRQLLERWQMFYEDEEHVDTVTSWALNSVNLVVATTQGIAGSQEFAGQHFDVVICDESSRVTRGEILVPADRADRIVLVGDEKQLPPYVDPADEQLIQALAVIQLSDGQSELLPQMAERLCDAWNVDEPEFRPVRVDEVCVRARALLEAGELPYWPVSVSVSAEIDGQLRAWRRLTDALTGSCFDHVLKLLPAERVVRLNVQRRMVAEMAMLVAEPVYGGDYQSSPQSPISPLLTQVHRHPWVFLNTGGYCVSRPEFEEVRCGTGFVNTGEAKAVVLALKQFVEAARRAGNRPTFMVITFYLAQALLIESMIAKEEDLLHAHIPALPIDRCQGQEADVVVVSFVRTPRTPRPGAGRWIQDVRRLNVALTRGRRSLLMVGNLGTLKALRGDADGERLLGHLARCVARYPDHQIEQMHGL